MADRIDHIGSTVPGLAAEDIIDVQVSVGNLDDPRLVPAFEKLGATLTDITAITCRLATRVGPRPGRSATSVLLHRGGQRICMFAGPADRTFGTRSWFGATCVTPQALPLHMVR